MNDDEITPIPTPEDNTYPCKGCILDVDMLCMATASQIERCIKDDCIYIKKVEL